MGMRTEFKNFNLNFDRSLNEDNCQIERNLRKKNQFYILLNDGRYRNIQMKQFENYSSKMHATESTSPRASHGRADPWLASG